MYICGKSIQTNEIFVTDRFGDITVAFTNGILSTRHRSKSTSRRLAMRSELSSLATCCRPCKRFSNVPTRKMGNSTSHYMN